MTLYTVKYGQTPVVTVDTVLWHGLKSLDFGTSLKFYQERSLPTFSKKFCCQTRFQDHGKIRFVTNGHSNTNIRHPTVLQKLRILKSWQSGKSNKLRRSFNRGRLWFSKTSMWSPWQDSWFPSKSPEVEVIGVTVHLYRRKDKRRNPEIYTKVIFFDKLTIFCDLLWPHCWKSRMVLPLTLCVSFDVYQSMSSPDLIGDP